MGAGSWVSQLSEAELHGFVDGHIDDDRRADVLRRLSSAPQDRALVEAWQNQGDLIRSAFRDVEHEVLPVGLDLAPPRLRCIDGGPLRPVEPLHPIPIDRRKGGVAAAAVLLVAVVVLAGAWLMIAQVGRGDDPSEIPASPTTLETTLADRAAAAADPDAKAAQVTTGGGLPAIRIPDLTGSGLTLSSVSSDPTEPASMVLHYSDGGDAHVALSVARLPQGAAPSAPAAVGKSLVWRRHDAAFAIAGTLPADKLRTIAATLQDDAGR